MAITRLPRRTSEFLPFASTLTPSVAALEDSMRRIFDEPFNAVTAGLLRRLAAGGTTISTLRPPAARLRAEIVPPCRRTLRSAIAKPMPRAEPVTRAT